VSGSGICGGMGWDGSNVRPGPEAVHYEVARINCDAHLLFNAFWTRKVSHFCVHRMLMRDHMHQIDLGVCLRHTDHTVDHFDLV
jgi:hypothetical protein